MARSAPSPSSIASPSCSHLPPLASYTLSCSLPTAAEDTDKEITELMQADELKIFLSDALHEKALRRQAKRAAWVYAIAVRKARMRPAPHGYGDGSYECICSRCDKAAKLDTAAEAAYAKLCDVDVRCSALCCRACTQVACSLCV